MKRIGKLLGLVALVAIMGLSLAGCGGSGSGSGDTNFFDVLNTGTPGYGALAIAGLSETQFDDIRNAGGAGAFRGWVIEYGVFQMVWANRTVPQFDALSTLVLSIRGGQSGGRVVEDGLIIFLGDDFELALFTSRISDGGFFLPANTIIAVFGVN